MDRLGTVEGDPPAGQVEPLRLALGDAPDTQVVGEIGAAAQRYAMLRDHPQPARGTAQEGHRCHQHGTGAEEEGVKHRADQPHVVVHGQPAADDVVRRRAEGVVDGSLVGHQVAMADGHAARRTGGAGGVLEQRRGLGVEHRRPPAPRGADLVPRRVEDLEIAGELARPGRQRPAAQHRRRTGVPEQPREPPLGSRRGHRHGHGTGVETGEEGDDEIEPRGQEQQDRSASLAALDELGGQRAGTLVEGAEGQALRRRLAVREEGEEALLGTGRGVL